MSDPSEGDAGPRQGHRRLPFRALAERWSLVIAFLVAAIVFSAARPDSFLTLNNLRAVLNDAAVLSVLAVGVTVVLVLGEFDLSIGLVVGLAGAAAVALMAFRGWPWWAAVISALVAGGLVGLANGVVVAYGRVPSFIATLAMGSIAAASELAITRTSIFQGLDPAYLEIARTRILGVPLRPIVAAAVVVVVLVLLRNTVFGRQAHSIGDNPVAARLMGVPVGKVMVTGFAIAGLTGGIAGILLTSSASSYYPNSGTGFLLPAYAAAFLGLSLGGGLKFNVLGSYLGVLLLGMVSTGLVMMNQPSWIAALVQGIVLLVAVAGIAVRRREVVGR